MQPLGIPSVSSEEVSAISSRLDRDWQIRLRTRAQYIDELESIPDEAAVARLYAAEAAAAAQFQAGSRKSNLEVETGYFRAVAAPGLHGLITSRHRAWILDAIALAVSVVRANHITGGILDVGCHAGHAASVLAHHLPNSIAGIDPLREAIDFGSAHAGRHPRVQLRHARMPLFGSDRFALILSVDAIPQKQKGFEEHIASYARNLEDDGIAIIVSSGWDHLDRARLNRILRKAKLGCKKAGVLGGYGGANEGEDNNFETRMVLILRKGATTVLPEDDTFFDIATSGWDAFRDYANASGTPITEKTHAFYWANVGANAAATA